MQQLFLQPLTGILGSEQKRQHSCLPDLPAGYSGEVLIGIVPRWLQGLQHLAKLLVVPCVDVITDRGQAPAHLAVDAANR